ncbi:MAG: hypothetical protein R3C28_32580 [Pirellulaceae bacterium]
MNRGRLQGEPQSQYDRPNQPWVCGHAAEGNPCPLGPNGRGVCRVPDDCSPVLVNERWTCNRSAILGGTCDQGPTPEGKCCCRREPCQPKRTLRSQRRRFIFGCFALTLGVLCIITSTQMRTTALAPGPLSANHAQLLNGAKSEEKCAACHQAGTVHFVDWMVDTVTNGGHLNESQHQRCLKCHDKSIPTEFALRPHSVAPSELDILTRLAASDSKKNPFQKVSTNQSHNISELACAQCHKEHHGAHHNLAALTDKQCQTCHLKSFDSFADDHPQFRNWPYRHGNRLRFDHMTHAGKHFSKEDKEFRCNDCHTVSESGAMLLVDGYSQCHSCHGSKIESSLASGVVFFGYPTIESSLVSQASAPKQWPKDAQFDFDGEVSDFMKLLLASDPAAHFMLRKFGPGYSLTDVDPDDPQDVETAKRLVSAMQAFSNELALQGSQAIQNRLRQLSATVNEQTIQAFSGSLDGQRWDQIRQRWFGGQPAENHRASPTSRWSANDTAFQLLYSAEGHGDPVLQAWYEILMRTTESADADVRSLSQYLFEQWSSPTAPGQCASCHDVRHKEIVWHNAKSNRTEFSKSFTRFNHQQHLIQPQLRDCRYCHQLDRSARPTSAEVSSDRHSSGFVFISKTQCSDCHTKQAASSSCTTCHRYHVDLPVGDAQRIVDIRREWNTKVLAAGDNATTR